MIKVIINNREYEIIKDYKDGFNKEELLNKYTDYFDNYDYVLGDWSYGKLRLKGFCDKKNSNLNQINNYINLEKYVKEECAYDCKYFVLKKI